MSVMAGGAPLLIRDVMAEFCGKDEDSGDLKLLHELPTVAQHRGKWTQVGQCYHNIHRS